MTDQSIPMLSSEHLDRARNAIRYVDQITGDQTYNDLLLSIAAEFANYEETGYRKALVVARDNRCQYCKAGNPFDYPQSVTTGLHRLRDSKDGVSGVWAECLALPELRLLDELI